MREEIFLCILLGKGRLDAPERTKVAQRPDTRSDTAIHYCVALTCHSFVIRFSSPPGVHITKACTGSSDFTV